MFGNDGIAVGIQLFIHRTILWIKEINLDDIPESGLNQLGSKLF
jgi:hypothetical protein